MTGLLLTVWYPAIARGSGAVLPYDLETFPLEVRTYTGRGSRSGRELRLRFINSAGELSGVYIRFTSPPQYVLYNCVTSWTNFETSLPSAEVKIWRFIFSRTSGSRLIVQCNDKEVLNILMSDTTCSYSYWRDSWNSKIELIAFSDYDTVSKSYRSSNGQV